MKKLLALIDTKGKSSEQIHKEALRAMEAHDRQQNDEEVSFARHHKRENKDKSR